MKRLLSILLVLLLAFSVLPIAASAQSGDGDSDPVPVEEDYRWISLIYINPEDGSELYEVDPEWGAVLRKQDVLLNGGELVKQVDGIEYDPEENTLYLDGYARPDVILDFSAMGDDFRLDVTGSCALAKINGSTAGSDNCLTIGGTGSLTVNNFNFYENAIEMYGEGARSTVSFDTDVEVSLGSRNAARIVLCNAKSADEAFTFNGEHNGIIDTQQAFRDEPEWINGYAIDKTLMQDDLGEQITLESDPDGFYTAGEFWMYEDGERVDFVEIEKYVYSNTMGVYVRVENTRYTLDEVPAYESTEEQLLNNKRVDTFEYCPVYEDGEGDRYVYIDRWSNKLQRDIRYLATYAETDLDGIYEFAIVAEDEEAQVWRDDLTEIGESITGAVLYDLTPQRSFLGYRLITNAPDKMIYTATEGSRWDENDEEIRGYWVARYQYYYDGEDEYFLRDNSFGDDWGEMFMTEDEFDDAGYEFDLEDNESRIPVENFGAVNRCDGEVYQDAEGARYARVLEWTEDGDIERFYTFAPMDGVEIDGTQLYLCTPVEDIDPDSLTECRIHEDLEGIYDYTLRAPEFENFIYTGTVTVSGEEEPIEFVDIGNTWENATLAEEYQYMVPLTVEVNPDEPGLTDQMYIQNEIWLNTVDGSTHERSKAGAMTPGDKYTYSVVLRAKKGYKFTDGFRFVYGGSEVTPDYTISNEGKILTLNNLITNKVFYLPAPEITGVSNTYTGAKITWTADKAAAKFRVFVKNGSSWKKLADVTGTSYVHTAAVSNTNYTYTVRAMNDNGAFISEYNKTGVSNKFYASPKISAFSNTAKGTQITWGKVAGAAKYRIFVKNGSSWKKLADTTALKYVNTAVKGGTAYTYTVRAMDKNGKFISAYNTTGWKYTFVATPAIPTLKNTKNGVQVTFKKSAGAAKYRIFRKTGSGGWKKLADTTKLTYVDKTAKNKTAYSYTIRCLDKNGKYVSAYNTTGRKITCKR